MTYEQLETCYKTVLKQRDEAEVNASQLETEVEGLRADLCEVASFIVKCFAENPISCGGAITVSTKNYNKLADCVNKI